MNNVWRSKRLIFRATEKEDETFFGDLQSDPGVYLQGAASVAAPVGKNSASRLCEVIQERDLLGAVICLPAPDPTPGLADEETKPIPIGMITLTSAEPKMAHHRHCMLGINILKQYQGQGYGSEAIRWALRWGFRFANMHRIELGAFGWNPGAIRLYERLGFTFEGRKREHFWFNGKYWDLHDFGMLRSEWEERYGKDED